MSGTGVARGWWTGWIRRLATAPHVPAVAAGLLGMAATVESVIHAVGAGATMPAGLMLCLVGLATTVPPALQRPVPAAMGVTAASLSSLWLFDFLTAAGMVAELIVLYRLGRDCPPRPVPQLAATALAMPFLLAGPVLAAGPALVWVGIAGAARAEARTHRADRLAAAGTRLEHTARGERARIARELHDVVAHHISMIAVQAETARLTTVGLPDAGARRLTEIGDTARAGLTEMRRLLGVLREDAGAEVADRRPQPSLQQLNELLDEARAASGAGARLIVSGAPVELDPGVQLAAFRIIQEALTNVRRHAPGAAVDVELHYGGEVLRVRVRDNGPGTPAAVAAGGHGLLGMRERAAAVGGRLRAGPVVVGGFLVEATLPASGEKVG